MDDIRSAYLSGQLSTRAYNALAANGYVSWSQVEVLDDKELSKLHGLGEKTLDEIRSLVVSRASESSSGAGESGSLPQLPLESERSRPPRRYTGREGLAEAMIRGDISSRTYRSLLQRGFHTTGDIARTSMPELARLLSTPKALEQTRALRAVISADDFEAQPPEPPLSKLTRLARILLSQQQWVILRRRERETLQELAEAEGVTRERIRQIEAKALRLLSSLALGDDAMMAFWKTALNSAASEERALVNPFVAGEHPTQEEREAARVLLRIIGAAHPKRFTGGPLDGYWAIDSNRLTDELRRLAAFMPCEDEDLDSAIRAVQLPPDLPIRQLLTDPGSPIRYHEPLGAWVRAVGRDRDAAWLLLQRRGGAARGEELAAELDVVPHNLEEALRRDARFVQILPEHTWAIADWNLPSSPYATTLDAVIAVLTELGSQPLAQLTRNVLARYPVTPGAVHQCVSHVDIGRWPDGRIDLASRGAPPIVESKPKRPASIFLEDGGKTLAIRQPVTADLLRGSGLGLPRYVSWFLGMHVAPDERTFHTLEGDAIIVRKRIQGTSISTLRAMAERLGAEQGCSLAIRLLPSTVEAAVTLACHGSCQAHARTGFCAGTYAP